ncbi:hypothetical protein BJX70DRAFT_396124 [Aspergillus crustosus]
MSSPNEDVPLVPSHYNALAVIPHTPTSPTERRPFICEIVRVGSSRYFDIELLVKDFSDRNFKVGFVFPIDEETNSTLHKYLKRGCTILILAVERWEMPDGGDGTIVGNPRQIKVLPFRLSYVKNFEYRIRLFTSVVRGKRLCYGCGDRKFAIHRCIRCKMFYFCYKQCQAYGDEQGNHLIECRILRDRDMAAIFRGQWNELEEFSSLSLRPQVSLFPGY